MIFGPEDDFTNKFAKMATISPFIPLINKGLTKFQPVYVQDVAKAVYICTESKVFKSTEQVTLISSRICSKIKQDK